MKRVRITFLTLTLLISKITFCQVTDRFDKNNFQLELFGPGIYYSVGYERNFINSASYAVSGQVNFSYNPKFYEVRDYLIPVSLNIQIPNKTHNLELGVGTLFYYDIIRSENGKEIGREDGTFVTLRIGYRYRPINSRFDYRIAFTPILDQRHVTSAFFNPWGAVSLGYRF